MSNKAIIKEIRESIKCKKYNEAIEKCQDILNDEPYMANLLLGAAYQSTNKNEAAKHLTMALEHSTGPPIVALQGLANCSPVEELPKIYTQLLKHLPEKYVDYYKKVSDLAEHLKVMVDCFRIFKRECYRFTGERRELALKYLTEIWLERDLDVIESDQELYKAALEQAIENAESKVHLKAFKSYLKILYREHNLEECIQKSCKFVEQYPNETAGYEWICKIYSENYQTKKKDILFKNLLEPIDKYADKLLKLKDNSSFGFLVKAIYYYEQHQYVSARELLERVILLQVNFEVAIKLLIRVYIELGAYGMALPLLEGLNKHADYEELAMCLSYEKSESQLRKAVNLLLMLKRNEQVVCYLARCYYRLNEINKIKELPVNPITRAEFLMSTDEAINYIETSKFIDKDSFDVSMLLGKLQMKIENHSDALMCFLKATRLQPQRSECFYYLGRIYYITNDMIRARKCLEKCIHLNPLCEEAINQLSCIYQQLSEENLNEALLLTSLKYIKDESSVKGIHFRLGLHYMSQNKNDDAIQTIRTAIKYDVTCSTYWEALGDAYAERGSYNSAIRVFQKLIEMNPDNSYAQLQIAVINTTIRNYVEAIEEFDILLAANPNYIPGLKGAAEAHIGLANNLKLEHRYGRCKEHFQFAINHLQRAFLANSENQMVWLWRLTASLFLQVAQLPLSLSNLEVSGKLAKRDTDVVKLTRKDLLNLAARFYTCALNLKQDTYLWYEIATCYYYCAELLPDDKLRHLEWANKACKMAIEKQSNRWHSWNLLGVIHLHEANQNLALAQHCFIQALQLDRKIYTAWTNLGALYLKINEMKLANMAFQRAQQSSPIYPHAWIGQAIIAEGIGEDEEALDLFRHCQQFEYHSEAALGFVNWVCDLLSNANKQQLPQYKHALLNMYADVMALDAIQWYTIVDEENSTVAALSFYGFLATRQHLYPTAVRAYKLAIEKSEPGRERDMMSTNLGYVYLKLNKPLEAINVFNSVSEATFKPIIGLALAYVRNNQTQEAYAIYNSILKTIAETDKDKAAKILVAMASMVYASQGEEDTKTLLYQCILHYNSPVEALYSSCALGILHKDVTLVETIIGDLQKIENKRQHCADISFLISQHLLTSKSPRSALIYLLKRVHIFPHMPALRKILAYFLADNYTDKRCYNTITSDLALGAIMLLHRQRRKNNICAEDSDLTLIASRALRPIDEVRSLKLVERAIHLNPLNQKAWHILQKVY